MEKALVSVSYDIIGPQAYCRVPTFSCSFWSISLRKAALREHSWAIACRVQESCGYKHDLEDNTRPQMLDTVPIPANTATNHHTHKFKVEFTLEMCCTFWRHWEELFAQPTVLSTPSTANCPQGKLSMSGWASLSIILLWNFGRHFEYRRQSI